MHHLPDCKLCCVHPLQLTQHAQQRMMQRMQQRMAGNVPAFLLLLLLLLLPLANPNSMTHQKRYTRQDEHQP
jgi:hypothetical protein